MKARWPITLMSEVLEVSPSGYFSWEAAQRRPGQGCVRSHTDEALLAHIRAIHEQLRGEYGWPRMHKELLVRGLRVGKERVRQLMQRHGIKAKGRKKFMVTTDSKHHLPVAPDLVQRRFNPTAPNLVWSGDITYLPTDEGWLYLAAVLDLHSRQVVGWSLQPHMHTVRLPPNFGVHSSPGECRDRSREMNEERSRGKYTLEFKQEAVRKVKAGRTASVVAKTLEDAG